MEFREIATFLQAAQLKSFSKAAKKLNYSQGTVTIQIKNPGIPNSFAALVPPISLASFTACTLYSWSYLRATLNTSLFS